MKITFDPAKREATLANRGLDFANVAEVFTGLHYTFADDRQDYGEIRNITVGYLGTRMVVVVWTPRGAVHHVISLRKANAREQKYYKTELG
jgi:uncharacterized DUF497 family protein